MTYTYPIKPKDEPPSPAAVPAVPHQPQPTLPGRIALPEPDPELVPA